MKSIKNMEGYDQLREHEEWRKTLPYITRENFDSLMVDIGVLQDKYNPYDKDTQEHIERFFEILCTPQKFPEFMKERNELYDKYDAPHNTEAFNIIGEEPWQSND